MEMLSSEALLNDNYKNVKDYIICLSKKLGEGQFGSVYVAIKESEKDCKNKIFYAVKMIPIDKAKKDLNFKSMLENEIKVLSEAKHKYLVSMCDKLVSQTNLYIFMDYCEGGTLTDFIQSKKNSRVSQPQTIEIFKQLVAGYKHVHDVKIIHRDLKPDNILFKKGEAKIADFGFGRMIQGDMDTPEQMSIKGTPLWSAPQILNREKYSSKCDVWSFGVILYQMLYGELPFMAKTEQELIKRLQDKTLKQKLTLPTSPKVSEKIKKLIQYMLRYREEERLSFKQFYEIIMAEPIHQYIQQLKGDKNDEDEVSDDKDTQSQAIQRNKEQLDKELVKRKLYTSSQQTKKLGDEQNQKEDEFDQYTKSQFEVFQIDQWFRFQRNSSIYDNFAFQIFDESIKDFKVISGIDGYHIGMIMYSLVSSFYNAVKRVYKSMTVDPNSKEFINETPFTNEEIKKYQQGQDFTDTFEIVENDMKEAKHLFSEFQLKIFHTMKTLQSSSSTKNLKNIDIYKPFLQENYPEDSKISQMLLLILNFISNQIKIGDLSGNQLKAIYCIQLKLQVKTMFDKTDYLDFDFHQFYQDQFEQDQKDLLQTVLTNLNSVKN